MILALITRAITDAFRDLRTLAGDYLAALTVTEQPTPVGTWPCGGVEECYCGTEKDVRGQFPDATANGFIEDRADDPFGDELDDYPVGEYTDLPIVPVSVPPAGMGATPAPTDFSTAGSGLVPGGGSPAAAGDHSTTSQLLDQLASWVAYLSLRYGMSSDALDDLVTAGHERAEACRAVEAMTRPLGDMLTDAAVETDQLAALGDPAYLVARANLSDALIAAAALVSRAVPHPADLSGGASKREVDSPAKRDP